MTDPCLDAEVLAAWADNALDTRAAAQVEAHASRCARCQAMLAAFVRTGPPPAPAFTPAMSWWPSLQIRWLVPVAAVATALAIWVAVPTGPTPERERAGLAEPGQRPQEAEAVTQAQVAPNVEVGPWSTDNWRVQAATGTGAAKLCWQLGSKLQCSTYVRDDKSGDITIYRRAVGGAVDLRLRRASGR